MTPSFHVDAFFQQLLRFADHLIDELHEKISPTHIAQIDHVCYRVSQNERYELWKSRLSTLGRLLVESPVNGRSIATYRFHQPPVTKQGYVIPLIELPAPKEGAAYDEGFEHVEVVTTISLEDCVREYAHISFDQKNMNKPINRDMLLPLKNGLVKFHEQSLEEIIRQEIAALNK